MTSPDRSSPDPDRLGPGGGRIRLSVESRLQSSGYTALRDVRCDFERREVRLYGTLPTHYLKQVAQALVAELEGVRLVENQIQVVPSAPRGTAESRECPEESGASSETS
jgi:osmotically-inducible protein OsmY